MEVIVLFAPRLRDYDISILAALGNKELNDVKYNQIKLLIIEKLLKANCSMFFLIKSFKTTNKILKESYATVIVILMKDKDYFIDEEIIEEIVKIVSLDDLISYGAESRNAIFSMKCVSEFWNRAPSIEDKNELISKAGLKRKGLKKIFNIKRKGD
jgi:hypothetical protein